MERVYATVRDGQLALDSPLNWPEGTRLELRLLDGPSAAQSGAGQGVRAEFASALNDTSSIGLSESFWPLTCEETELLIEHMDSAEPVLPTPEDQQQFESDLAASKQLQRELVRTNWENPEPVE